MKIRELCHDSPAETVQTWKAEMKRIQKISVTVVRRRVIRIETPAEPGARAASEPAPAPVEISRDLDAGPTPKALIPSDEPHPT